MYVCTYAYVYEKEAWNLKEGKEGYMAGFGGKKEKGKLCDYIII